MQILGDLCGRTAHTGPRMTLSPPPTNVSMLQRNNNSTASMQRPWASDREGRRSTGPEQITVPSRGDWICAGLEVVWPRKTIREGENDLFLCNQWQLQLNT
jgi:hypothetical protein